MRASSSAIIPARRSAISTSKTSRADARRIQSIFGSKPEFQYFEAPIVIDNAAKEVVDNAA
jgi:hypothetical protein